MGGMIATELCLLRPQTFVSCTLTSTHAGRTLPPLTMVTAGPKFFFAAKENKVFHKGKILFPESFYESDAPDDFKPESEFIISEKVKFEGYKMKHVIMESHIKRSKLTKPINPKVMLLQWGATITHYVSPDRLKDLSSSHIKFLVVCGLQDVVIRPSNSIYLAKQLDCKLELFENAGHGLIEQLAKQYNNLVENFINSV
ncbi:hypothetical protein HK099_004364 [Clydaea vesicula]|uniref:Uncharacterized protein n=1 Tax=Clydaea vesicula TaxID=447962 RepID=A0AAD5U0T2_9FUNG|nr:hypothetical protein HK099_004364 [Clydaea vesicula]